MSVIEAFRFDGTVADVFEDMIERSVPGYRFFLELIGILAKQYAIPGTNCYDLGCSLGASTLQLKHHVPDSCHVIGIDNSSVMVDRCKVNLAQHHSAASSEIRLGDIREAEIENASIIVLNFTLQFLPNEERLTIFRMIANGLLPGGILLLAEKVTSKNKHHQHLMTRLHHEFKKYHGYSNLEIAQKRAALETVLISNTEDEHRERLFAVGFRQVHLCAQCLNFAAILAVK